MWGEVGRDWRLGEIGRENLFTATQRARSSAAAAMHLLTLTTALAGRGLVLRPRAAACTMGVDATTKLWTPDDVLWTPAEKGGGRAEAFGSLGKYCEDLSEVRRRKTRTVTAGPVKFGSNHPIVRQTMGTTSTRDVRGTVEQALRAAVRGGRKGALTHARPTSHARCR